VVGLQFAVPLRTINPAKTVQFQEVAECTLTGTVMLNLILLDSLNEFLSYKKPVFSKWTLFICALLFTCEGQGFPLEYNKRKSVTTN